jgi:hypothetical protein
MSGNRLNSITVYPGRRTDTLFNSIIVYKYPGKRYAVKMGTRPSPRIYSNAVMQVIRPSPGIYSNAVKTGTRSSPGTYSTSVKRIADLFLEHTIMLLRGSLLYVTGKGLIHA